MTEMRSATEVFKALERHRQSGFPGWVWFAPGDHTRYRVHLIHMRPVHADGPKEQVPVTRVLLVQVETDPRNPKSVVIAEPGEYARFTPEMWVNHGHPPGWWGGVRPLLAALGWTDEGYDMPEFEPADAADIAYLIERAQRGRRLARVR
jgi:hypothetical protein